MNWYVGQQVYCLKNGAGVIIDNDQTLKYCISVEFPGSWQRYSYTNSGHSNELDATPMLYPSKPEITVPKWQPKEGEWCWFWDASTNGSYLAKFSRINESEFYISHAGSVWKNCAPFIGELPEHLKEVEK